MINLQDKIGILLEFNPESVEIKLGLNVNFMNQWEKTLEKNGLWKSLRFAHHHTDDKGRVITEPELWNYRNPGSVLYHGFQGIWKGHVSDLVARYGIRPDVTALHGGRIGSEYIRTEGHEHLSGFPEIYETVYGNNGYLLFKTAAESGNREDIAGVMFVIAEPGDHVVFPPGYQHITVNLGREGEGFLMTDWVSPNARTDFQYIKRHNGAPYWVTPGKTGLDFIKNPKYKGRVPPVRRVRPAEEIPELGLKKGRSMFDLERVNIDAISKFLNSDSEQDFFKRIFVDF